MTYFPFVDFWWVYAGLIFLVLAVLVIDLGVFNKKAHVLKFKEAMLWTVTWFILAMVFCAGFYFYSQHLFSTDPIYRNISEFNPIEMSRRFALEFLTGYLIELFLSVDNLFIFIVIFKFFSIPQIHQHRILFYGILGALIFRGIFIALGSALMGMKFVIIFFGGLLVYTGMKMLFSKEQEDINPENNILIRILKKFFPMHPKIEGQKFFVKINNLWHMTPLFVALVFLEITDVVFALDSVPAIFAITKEPLIVFTSNIFAILGLRSLYFTVMGVLEKFEYLKYGLGFILVFVGNKMLWLNEYYGGHFPVHVSLGVIVSVLALCVIASIFKEKVKQRRVKIK